MRRLLVAAACAAFLSCRATPPPPAEGSPEALGKAIFLQQCAICHNPDSLDKKMGPGLKSLFKRDKLSDGKPPSDATVRARIDRGGTGMPPFSDMFSAPEMTALMAYLKTL